VPESTEKIIARLGLNKLVQRVKFGGVVGKQTLLGIATVAGLAVIAWKAESKDVIFIAIAAAVIALTIAVLNFCYARSHPVEAMMEGTEMLVLQHQVLASKSVEPPKSSPVIPNPEGTPPQLNPPLGADQ
jgi:hypothetical protein